MHERLSSVGRNGAAEAQHAGGAVAALRLMVTSPCLVLLLLSGAAVHGLHVSSYQLLRGDAAPAAADRQLLRECEQALRSDSSSEDAQQLDLGALAARPLAMEVAHVGDQGGRLRRFWLPRGLSASVQELEVEAGHRVNGRPEASASGL